MHTRSLLLFKCFVFFSSRFKTTDVVAVPPAPELWDAKFYEVAKESMHTLAQSVNDTLSVVLGASVERLVRILFFHLQILSLSLSLSLSVCLSVSLSLSHTHTHTLSPQHLLV